MSEDWKLDVVSVTDGDTIRGHLTREAGVVDGWGLTVHSTNVKGVPLRLIILDTPERGQQGYSLARMDVLDWCAVHVGSLRCETYQSAGWDRLLADVYVNGERGNTLTQHMLRSGWESYIR